MGLLDKILHLGQPPSPEEELRRQQEMMGAGQQVGGQLPPAGNITVIPPSLDEKTMDKLLVPQFPEALTKDPTKLAGVNRFWPFTTSYATTIQTGNLNGRRQEKVLESLQIAMDLDGLDDVEYLIQNEMIEIAAEVVTGKARSDLPDGIRDRLAIGAGIGMSGTIQGNRDLGERPKESRAIFGIAGRRQ